jgi:DNA-binding IclR family transcriptional regulator
MPRNSLPSAASISKTRLKSTAASQLRPVSKVQEVASTSPVERSADLKKPVGAVISAIRILRHLAEQGRPVSVTNVVRGLGIHSSTCFNILRTLAHEGLVSFDPENKAYSLGLGIIDIARGAANMGDSAAWRPKMEAIARESAVTVSIWRKVAPDRQMLVQSASTAGAVRIQMSIGQRLPLLVGGGGRIWAAFGGLRSPEIRSQFSQIRWGRPISLKQYLKEVGESRARGWAIDDGYLATGTMSVSVPVFNREGRLIMTCSGTSFVDRLDAKRAARVAGDLASLSAIITQVAPNL